MIISVGLSFLWPILYLLNLQMQNLLVNSFTEWFITYCLPPCTVLLKILENKTISVTSFENQRSQVLSYS